MRKWCVKGCTTVLPVTQHIGIATTAAQLACMKAVPFRTLENAVISTEAAFGLTVDSEPREQCLSKCPANTKSDITIFGDTAARAAAGNFLHVPLLSGSVAQEEDIFLVAAQQLSPGITIPVVTEILSDAITQVR